MIQTLRYQDHFDLAYADPGPKTGFPILIQHGLIASIDDTALFQALLDLGARPISIARPGYGASSPYELKNMAAWGEVAAALVEALDLPCFDVLGISSGAPYAYALAHHFPIKARHVFILSGIPALYDERVQARWPYPIDTTAQIPALQKLAHELFFAQLSAQDLQSPDVRDSMQNDCFGIAQDLKIRVQDWGFRLEELRQNVTMRHSQTDGFLLAETTARMLPHCRLEARANDPHFSKEVLEDFIRASMAPFYS